MRISKLRSIPRWKPNVVLVLDPEGRAQCIPLMLVWDDQDGDCPDPEGYGFTRSAWNACAAEQNADYMVDGNGFVRGSAVGAAHPEWGNYAVAKMPGFTPPAHIGWND
jgi:hypothetical protein